jgi:S-DNA-T family DNA segregation ATPase FtsK/SpoIIIE
MHCASSGMLGSMEHCDQCGLTYEDVATDEVGGILRGLSSQYLEVLSEADRRRDLRTRPAPSVWSAIEYVCHVRDVLLIQRDRVILALVENSPSFPRMYRDERAVLIGYNQEAVQDVVDELDVATNLFAKVFDRLSAEQLERSCIYNFPEPTERDIGWLGRHTVHETKHHLDDMRSVLTQLSS